MKYTIGIIMGLLCSPVFSGNVSHAANSVKEYSGTYLDDFTHKCEIIVRDVWETIAVEKRAIDQYANFDMDVANAEEYVDKYSRLSHQSGAIQDDLVKALYEQMKLYAHISPKSYNLVKVDELIKEGSLGFMRQDVEDLENIKYARLLCKIAYKIFTRNGDSERSLNNIYSIESDLESQRDIIKRQNYVAAEDVKIGHERAVLNILSKASEQDLEKINLLFCEISYFGRSAKIPLNTTIRPGADFEKTVVDNYAKYSKSLEEYNSIIDRLGIREHLK